MTTTPPDPISFIADDPAVRAIIERTGAGRAVQARGVGGSSTTLLAAALTRSTAGPVLLILAHLDDADEALDVLEAFDVGRRAIAGDGDRGPARRPSISICSRIGSGSCVASARAMCRPSS